jgi:dihydropteroate synthase
VYAVYLFGSTKIMEHPDLQTLNPKITLTSKGQLITLDKPSVMGILNITPDSFFDGGLHDTADKALKQVEKMLKEGARFIDIGAYSSRPNAPDISEDDEMSRLIPVVTLIAGEFPEAFLSIDTFRSRIAREAIQAGGHLVNDIASGDDDPDMLQTVAGLNIPYIMMHKKGTPQTMQQNPLYDNVTLEVIQYFTARIMAARKAGIKDLVLDPGFGFGKTLEHNYTLLNQLGDLRIFELPLLIGLSRKGMLQKVIQGTAGNALNATTAANTIALLNGANIIRVHDVKEAVECINIVSATYGTF